MGDDTTDNALYEAYNEAADLPGTEVARLAALTRQIIDGTFQATHPERGRAWLTLRAIDSTLWEIEASEPRYLEGFRDHFRDVRPTPEGGVW